MAEDQIQQTAPQGQAAEPTAPSQTGDGQAKQQAVEDLPDKFKGKSASDIAKSYLELERKLGENSQEVNLTRQYLANWEALGKVIQQNPVLLQAIEQEIAKVSQTKQEAPNPEAQAPKRDDTRLAVESSLINDFERRFGIDQLPSEDRGKLQQRIGLELVEMLDPKGDKTTRQVLDDISLERLPRYLEKAYKLATDGDRKERERAQAILEARRNNEASLGSIPSSGVNSQTKELTPEQKKVARRLNISEEKYLKQVEEIEKERQ